MHAGAVIVPAVLAACERHKPDGAAALLGIAVGYRSYVPAVDRGAEGRAQAGFHPTAIFGVMGAAAGVGAALGLNAKQLVDALGIAGSFASASSNISLRALGPSGSIPAGRRSPVRAALLARAGFLGPRTVFEGMHGLFHGFAHTTQGDYAALEDFGSAG